LGEVVVREILRRAADGIRGCTRILVRARHALPATFANLAAKSWARPQTHFVAHAGDAANRVGPRGRLACGHLGNRRKKQNDRERGANKAQ